MDALTRPLNLPVACGGLPDRLVLVEVAALDVAFVEVVARSRAPVFCCCSRCNLIGRVENIRCFFIQISPREPKKKADRGYVACLKTHLVVTPVVIVSTMHCGRV